MPIQAKRRPVQRVVGESAKIMTGDSLCVSQALCDTPDNAEVRCARKDAEAGTNQ